ncbi:MAG: 30S ribosome-binding factor RbfA [Myxococcota bacterium]
MPTYRPERVAEMIHRELAERLRSEIKDPRVGPISITAIEVTRDLSRAVVSFLPLGGGGPSDELAEGLADAARRLRGPIGRALRLRHAPEIVFSFDEHTDRAFRVTSLIDRLAADRRAAEPAIDEPADDAVDGAESEGSEE